MHQDDQYRAARREKMERLRAVGIDPYGQGFTPSYSVAAARALAPDPVEGDEQPRGQRVVLAGRIGNLRKAGAKLRFASLFDRSRADLYLAQQAAGRDDLEGAEAKKERGIQLYLDRQILGDDGFAAIAGLDLADWVGVEGPVGRTRTGEISVFVERLVVLGKAQLPPPHQAGASRHELSPEIRQRQRYLDLMMSDQSLARFVVRSRLVEALRGFFTARGYLEVETPMMHTVLGGASARPFVTHHNALDLDLYLRIAPELHLKRLLVGGLERVFEVNRNFRNEGIDLRHNPEFTMVEWYEAYADHHRMMDLTEELLRHLADTVLGHRQLQVGAARLDLDQPFARLGYHQALRQFGGLDHEDQEAVATAARSHGLDPAAFASHERLVDALWAEVVEPHLVQPTFITDQPAWLSPLCRTHAEDPSITMRFELFINRMELANAFTELNDPDQQRARFAAQRDEALAARDDEAGIADGRIDEDYCTALDHGLPCCGGEGLGIDRLVMLFTGTDSIRDVILFPTMRPH